MVQLLLSRKNSIIGVALFLILMCLMVRVCLLLWLELIRGTLKLGKLMAKDFLSLLMAKRSMKGFGKQGSYRKVKS
jgi:hypothetical protein